MNQTKGKKRTQKKKRRKKITYVIVLVILLYFVSRMPSLLMASSNSTYPVQYGKIVVAKKAGGAVHQHGGVDRIKANGRAKHAGLGTHRGRQGDRCEGDRRQSLLHSTTHFL